MFICLLVGVVLFIVFGVIFNIVNTVEPSWYNRSKLTKILEIDPSSSSLEWHFWSVILVFSFGWFFLFPILFVVITLLLMKTITGKIAEIVLKGMEKKGVNK